MKNSILRHTYTNHLGQQILISTLFMFILSSLHISSQFLNHSVCIILVQSYSCMWCGWNTASNMLSSTSINSYIISRTRWTVNLLSSFLFYFSFLLFFLFKPKQRFFFSGSFIQYNHSYQCMNRSTFLPLYNNFLLFDIKISLVNDPLIM